MRTRSYWVSSPLPSLILAMKLYFRDPTFSFELLRAASYGMYGGSEIGEVLAAANRIREGDFESSHTEWSRVAERIEMIAGPVHLADKRARSG